MENRKASVQKRDWSDEEKALEEIERANARRAELERADSKALKWIDQQLNDEPEEPEPSSRAKSRKAQKGTATRHK